MGATHRTSSLDVLERLTISADDLPKALATLTGSDNLNEVVVLSTCHRIEIYAEAELFHGGCADVRDFLARHSGISSQELSDQLYTRHDLEAVSHLFGVAAGLDSVVIGEHEILGQVRGAYQAAQGEGTVGSRLDRLFSRALETGKQARSATDIGKGIASVSQAAVALAAERFGGGEGLEGRRVLLLGAGTMAKGTLQALADAGLADLAVASRTFERSVAAAQECGGRAVPLEDLATVLVDADLLMTTTGASEIILEHSSIDAVMSKRDGKALLIIDVAVPRDVEVTAGDLDGVTLLNMDDVNAYVEAGRADRSTEADKVREIVAAETERFQLETSARSVAPVISALRERASEISEAELARYEARLSELTPAQLAAVESLVRGVTNKMLHEPTVRLKDAAGHARGDRLAEAIRDLFDL